MTTQSRRWCFTENNPEGELTDETFKSVDYVRGAIWQLEEGDNNTPHYQGYLECKRSTRLSQLKKLLPRANWSVARNDGPTCIAYCSKEDTRHIGQGPYTYGNIKAGGQGKRNDLRSAIDLVKSGGTDYDLAINDDTNAPFVKYTRGLRELRLALNPRRSEKTIVHWLYGDSETGKSHDATTMFAHLGAFWIKPPNNKWFDGYQGEPVVVFDEFCDSWFTLDFMKRILDRLPLTVETKGGSKEFTAKALVITSNRAPHEFYKNALLKDTRGVKAYYRRLDKIVCYTGEYPNVTKTECTGKEYFADLVAKQTGVSENFVLPKTLGYVTDEE